MGHRVAILVFDDAQMLDAVGPLEVFSHANGLLAESAYALITLSADGGEVRFSNGQRLLTESLTQAGALDTLLVAGGSEAGIRSFIGEAAHLAWLRDQAGRVRRLCSVCTGAFVLGAAGLLGGRRATTHWASCDRLAEMFPDVRVERHVIFTAEGGLFTSAGVSTGIDLALHLVEQDHGRALAYRVARQLVLYLRRTGSTPQLSAALAAQTDTGQRIAAVVEHILARPDADLRVPRLAERAHMSERHFARCFREEVGVSVALFVTRARLERARLLLSGTRLRVAEVARRSGFGSADVLARRFSGVYGLSPTDYRAAAVR